LVTKEYGDDTDGSLAEMFRNSVSPVILPKPLMVSSQKRREEGTQKKSTSKKVARATPRSRFAIRRETPEAERLEDNIQHIIRKSFRDNPDRNRFSKTKWPTTKSTSLRDRVEKREKAKKNIRKHQEAQTGKDNDELSIGGLDPIKTGEGNDTGTGMLAKP
jgi:hypothetical protein